MRLNRHDAVNEFLRSKQSMGRSDRTLKKYSQVLYKLFHEYFPDKEPGEITVGDMEEYIRLLEKDFEGKNTANNRMTNKTKKTYLNHVSSFYSWAMKRPRFEEITGNPAGVVSEEIQYSRRERPECATWENAKRIVHAIEDPRNRLAAAIMAKTGIRVSELVKIRTEDVLLDTGFIRLQWRKGGKSGYVPIDAELKQTFHRFEVMRQFPEHEFLIVSRERKPLHQDRVREYVKRAAVQADVMDEGEKRWEHKFTPHTFRTVFTTMMREQGMQEQYIAYIRGDSSSRNMVDWYTRVDRNQVRDAYTEKVKLLDL